MAGFEQMEDSLLLSVYQRLEEQDFWCPSSLKRLMEALLCNVVLDLSQNRLYHPQHSARFDEKCRWSKILMIIINYLMCVSSLGA